MYRNPSLAVDAVVIKKGKILLVRRKNEPYKGMLALPGGFVEYGEKTEDAVLRELKEETGMKGRIKSLVGVFSDPMRDPRGHVVSIAYLVEAENKNENEDENEDENENVKAGDDAEACEWVKIEDLMELAFDHIDIVKKALEVIE